nr:PREDICTED: uncharacterized protein LOC109041600 [Bemisia tabaci]
MERLEETAPFIIQDSVNCLRGIENSDEHLIEVNLPRIGHYIEILTQLVQQNVDEHLREIVSQTLTHLQHLSVSANECLARIQIMEQADQVKPDMSVAAVTELRRMDLPWSKIAAFYQISRQGMYNFRKKYQIQEPNQEVSDAELQFLISELAIELPRAGARYMKGALTTMGKKVTWKRVKDNLRQANPAATLLRRRQKIIRRKFKVKGANYLWSMDSNHKLIHYRIVIHGCVDGFSRKIIYLNAASDNTADTVLQMFYKGMEENGIPVRVRGDKGSENARVKDCMQELRQNIVQPFIQGRSVHNVRIERLWKETNMHPTWKFKQIFKYLESIELLDEHSEFDLFCLSYVFLPRIQNEMNNFAQIWNNHSMSTMQGRTPLQTWTLNMMNQSHHVLEAPNDPDLVNNHHDNLDDNDENSIIVPRFSDELIEIVLPHLLEVLPDPLADDHNHGINNYILVRNRALGIFQPHD